MEIQRRFSPLTLLILSINGMVGSAWLFAPYYAAKIAGSGALVAWVIAGGGTAIIALTFAEISAMFPLVGGTAQLPQVSHGLLTSFTLSFIAWLSALTMAPIEVMAVLQYASTFFPSLIYNSSGESILTLSGYCWATGLMLAFCIINIVSFKGLVRFNFFIFVFKISIILLTVFVLMHVSFHSSNFSDFQQNFSLKGWQSILTAVASGGIAFAFTGFKHGVELAGEVKKSALGVPLAVVGSVLCCLFLYIALQVAFIGALTPTSLQNGWHNLTFAGDVGPFAGLIAGLGIFWLLKLLYLDAVVSPTGAGLIYVTSTARILYAMSEIGYVPKFLSYLNKEDFPVLAILVNFIIGMLLFFPLPGWQSMVSFLVSGMVISYAIGPIALVAFRLDLPNMPRKFKLPAANLLCILAFYFCNLLCYWTGWETIYKLMLAILLGFVVFGMSLIKNHQSQPLGLKSVLWLIPYLGGLTCISYLGAFGGKNIISFGWDFLVMGIFSIVTFLMAIKCRSLQTPINP
jgi:amino acid transporter